MNLRGANRLMGIAAGRFDGHAHVFRADLPMAGNRRYTPGYDAEFGDYCSLLRANGLDGALLVQPSFLGTDNGFLLAALERAQAMDDLQFRGVAMLAPETSADAIAALSAAGIVGLRLNLVGGAARGFDFAAWDGLLRRIDRAGWHVELHAEGPLLSPLLTGLLARCETVVIDHFGLPDPERPLECEGFGALLASPPGRTLVKISAPYRVFPALGPAEAPAACTPLLARLAEALGPDQLVWGSDWPWTRFEDRQSYAETLEWFT